jgi:hypothetical protein
MNSKAREVFEIEEIAFGKYMYSGECTFLLLIY